MKMVNHKNTLYAGIACILMCGNLSAQETNFDLSSQRSEKQDVLAVPGEKVQPISPQQVHLNKNNVLPG